MFKYCKSSLTLLALVGMTSTAVAQSTLDPAPTPALLEAAAGPHATARLDIAASGASGFGGGAVYYPTQTGRYGAIALCPGFGATRSSLTWLSQRLASHGFVVIAMDTLSTMDSASSRAVQLRAGLNHLARLNTARTGPLRGKVDATRMGVGGEAMGGAGSLQAARDNTSYKANFSINPGGGLKSVPTLRVPSMLTSSRPTLDRPINDEARVIYPTLPLTTRKAYMEYLYNPFTTLPAVQQPVLGKYAIAWFKRFVNNDTRYSPFLCGAPHQADLRDATKQIVAYMENCPY